MAGEDAVDEVREARPDRPWLAPILWAGALLVLTLVAVALTRDAHDAEPDVAASPATTSVTRSEVKKTPAAPAVAIDLDADGTSDPAVLHDGDDWVLGSAAGPLVLPGPAKGAVVAPGDYDGDGTTELATVAPRGQTLAWTLGPAGSKVVGRPGDRPVPADYDGDGKTDVAVAHVDGKDLTWIVGSNRAQPLRFGLADDQPVPADYDGDGRTDLAVRRRADWYVLRSSDGRVRTTAFGLADDLVAPGDFTGDGLADLAVVRPVDGRWVWFVLPSEGGDLTSTPFGRAGSDRQIPVAGDFDGDGRTEPAVADLEAKAFFHLTADPDQPGTAAWGGTGDRPLSRLLP